MAKTFLILVFHKGYYFVYGHEIRFVDQYVHSEHLQVNTPVVVVVVVNVDRTKCTLEKPHRPEYLNVIPPRRAVPLSMGVLVSLLSLAFARRRKRIRRRELQRMRTRAAPVSPWVSVSFFFSLYEKI